MSNHINTHYGHDPLDCAVSNPYVRDMTRWCPVCESPGIPVAQGTGPFDGQQLLAVSRDLPGIEPSHVCSQCPTFFRSRDRFYLTALDGQGIHGISVWPHRESPLVIEIGDEGLFATFRDGASVLVSRDDAHLILTDFFRGLTEREIEAWASRRGFGLRLVPASQQGIADLVVDRPGPHFVLRVTKSWFQLQDIRCTEAGIDHLESIGVEPVLFPPLSVHA